MGSYLAKNNAYSTLASGLTDVATTLTVQAGHGDRFPIVTGTDYTYVTLEDNSNNIEIVKVTARASASDSMTITRAQEGTTARAWNIGDIVECRPTAGIINDKASLTTPNSYSAAQNLARATVASHATTADIWGAAGNQIDWTGTATTTAFPAAPQAGSERTLICAGACSFTAGANMLIDGVTSGNTVTYAVNDEVHVKAISTTQFKLTRLRYDGTAGLGANIFTDDQGLSDKKVSRAMLIDCGSTVKDKGNISGATVTFDYPDGSDQKYTATGSTVTWGFSNWPPTGNLGVIRVHATDIGAYTHSITGINWVKPDRTFTTTFSAYLTAIGLALPATGLVVAEVWSRDAGSTLYGKLV